MINRFILALIVINFVLLFGCEREEEVTPPVEAVPIQQLDTFTTEHKDAGILKWTLIGKSSEFRANTVTVQSPKVEIYEEGKISITLTSKTGYYYTKGKDKDNLYLNSEVVGVNENGTLYTEKLQWRNKNGTLFSPTEVKIVRGDSTWNGTDMVANPNLETVTMSNNRFELFPKDEDINE